MFALTDPTEAKLATITARIEQHGDEEVPASSFGLKITGHCTLLDLLSKTLRSALYEDPAQASIDGVPVAQSLRSKDIDFPINVVGKYDGWTWVVDHGIDEHDPITFGKCKCDAFKVTAIEGGSVELSLRIGTSDIDAERLGIIGMKLGQNISIRLLAPAKVEDKPTDGRPTLIDASSDGDAPPVLTPEAALAASAGAAS